MLLGGVVYTVAYGTAVPGVWYVICLNQFSSRITCSASGRVELEGKQHDRRQMGHIPSQQEHVGHDDHRRYSYTLQRPRVALVGKTSFIILVCIYSETIIVCYLLLYSMYRTSSYVM